MTDRIHLDDDWFALGLPSNVVLEAECYVDSSYALGAFRSRAVAALRVGTGSGIYDRSNLVAGPGGRITIGRYSCLNGTTIVAHDHVEIGSYCLLSWSVVISDEPCGVGVPREVRAAAMRATAADPARTRVGCGGVAPIVIEDNVWIGFGSYVGPGVRIGRGAVVGSRTVVLDDVAPYSVVVGAPARVVSTLDPSDTDAAVEEALRAFGRTAASTAAGGPFTGRIANTRGNG